MPDPKTCQSCFETIDPRAVRCPHCQARQPDAPGLYRDVPGKLLAGCCAAIARHFDWDVTLVRVLFVISVAFTGGLVFWVYAALWLMTPFAALGRAPAQRAWDSLANVFASPTAQPETHDGA